MNLVFAVEPPEIRTAVGLVLRPVLRRLGGMLIVVLLIAAAVLYLRVLAALFVLLGVAALLGLLLARFLWMTRRSLAETYHRMGQAQYWIDQSGVRMSSAMGEVALPWSAFSGYVGDAKVTVLRQVNGAVLVLPQRALNPEQRQWLAGLLTTLDQPGAA